MSDAGRTCDELRLMARLVRECEYEEISRMLRKAADTILVMDERLREADRHHRIDMEVIGLMYHPEIVERIEAENAKLRELCMELWPFVKAGWDHACPNRECCLFEECDADSEYKCLIEEHMAGRMRDLGIEVDG